MTTKPARLTRPDSGRSWYVQGRPHGTRSTYLYGCRCRPCVEANREYRRQHDRRQHA